MTVHYSDRSRSIDYQECPRSFWFQYVLPNGTPISGIVPDKLNMDLTTGLGTHEGANHLLEGCSVDEAVGRALEGYGSWEGYWPIVKSRGFNLSAKEDAGYVAHEQASLVEALIRGWAVFGLPQIQERFQIVEAERDEYGTFVDGDFKLIWGMRGDALLLDRNTYDLFILSLKTKKEWKGNDDKKNRYDMQGLSETAVVEQRLRKWHDALETMSKTYLPEQQAQVSETLNIPGWFFHRWKAGAGPNVMGVKMDFMLKGQRREDKKDSGVYKYNNAMIRPWKRDDGFQNVDYAFRYEFKDAMGGNHRLGKGWDRINIWEDIGVKDWIGMLATQEVQNLEAMTGIADNFVFPTEYFRQEEEIEEWKEMRLFEEQRIARGIAESLPAVGTKLLRRKLNEHFPKYSNYPTDCTYCSFEDVCHGGIEAQFHDPMSTMKFAPRSGNHNAEKNLIQITS